MRVSLVEIKQRAGGKRVRLDHVIDVESLHIGRGPDNDLSLKGLTVSLHHATIRIGDGHAYIEAATGSDIHVNGLPTQGERLALGDEIHVGPWTLRSIRPEAGEDLRLEYEKRERDDDARAALDKRTHLGIERGVFARRPLSWVAIGGVLLAFLFLPLIVPAMRPAWTTGEVVRGHAIIEDDCASCHGGLFQRVENSACTACHVDVRRHAPLEATMLRLEDMQCAECHLEHRGREVSLAAQGAAFCVSCHANWKAEHPESEMDDAADFGSDHPGIKLSLIVDPALPPVRQSWAPDLVENSGVDFDHHLHVSQELDGTDDSEWLDCGGCHRPAADGVAMQPVEFDRDCRRCHELDAGEPELVGQIVHGDPDRVREQLRNFYTKQVLEARIEDPSAPRILRRRRPGRLVGREERTQSAQWIGGKVAAADAAIFGEEGCALCHDTIGGVVSGETGEWRPRAVAPVRIARRWIENARFSHAAHGTHPCALCHAGAAVRDPDGSTEDEPSSVQLGSIPYGLIDADGEVVASDSASDVLIPGIETCRSCHVSEGRAEHHKVASPCSTCHDFHDHRLEPMATGRVDRDVGPSGDAGAAASSGAAEAAREADRAETQDADRAAKEKAAQEQAARDAAERAKEEAARKQAETNAAASAARTEARKREEAARASAAEAARKAKSAAATSAAAADPLAHYLEDVDDRIVLNLDGKKYKRARFDHRKHATGEYWGDLTCQTCHHTQEGDESPASCNECHDIGGDADEEKTKKRYVHAKGMAYPMDPDQEQISCVSCHKAMNNMLDSGEREGKKAPTKCTKCHARNRS